MREYMLHLLSEEMKLYVIYVKGQECGVLRTCHIIVPNHLHEANCKRCMTELSRIINEILGDEASVSNCNLLVAD